MNRFKISIEYDGSQYSGWQRQSNAVSIQESIETAIYKFSSENVKIFGAGRTDAGVHAYGQVAHFDLSKNKDEKEVLRALNHYLRDKKISIISCKKTDNNFHARFSAKSRSYKYIILNRESPPSIEKHLVWHIYKDLDIAAMIDASKYFLGTHDFTSFRASECQAHSPIKTINKIEIKKINDKIEIDISAKSFLHHMVRNIVGTLVLVGNKKIEASDIKLILESKDRSSAGATAPACGLYFMNVEY